MQRFCAAMLTVAVLGLLAQGVLAGPQGKGQGQGKGKGKSGQRPSREEMLKRFDKDGDGKLSPEERKAAMQARQNRMSPEMKAKMKEIVKKYDLNKNGKLDPAERKAASGEMRKLFASARKNGQGGKKGGKKGAGGKKGGNGQRPSREEILKRFDKDGDGKLSPDERQAAQEARKKRQSRKGKKK